MYSQDTISRFWSKVDKSGGPDACWPWLAGRNAKGYGRFNVGKKLKRANRVAYEIATGEELGDDHALHTCDNPPCCNPAHLFRGTGTDNQRDCFRKGRDRRRRYSRAIVDEVLGRFAAGERVMAISRAMKIPDQTVSDIRLGKIRSLGY